MKPNQIQRLSPKDKLQYGLQERLSPIAAPRPPPSPTTSPSLPPSPTAALSPPPRHTAFSQSSPTPAPSPQPNVVASPATPRSLIDLWTRRFQFPLGRLINSTTADNSIRRPLEFKSFSLTKLQNFFFC